MPIEHLTVKTNCVIWSNIHLPHPKANLKSSVFCIDGKKWYIEVSCTWGRDYNYVNEIYDEFFKFNIKSGDSNSSNDYIIIPYLKTSLKYVRLGTHINIDIRRSVLSSIVGSTDIITVLFYFSPYNLMPPDFKDIAVACSEDDLGEERKYLCLEDLSEDIVQLFNKDGYADATLKCVNRSFLVHRNILAARSTVFSSMFENDMSEKRAGVVEIVDLDENILEQFLLYLYSGKVNELSTETALKLYKTADKYDVGSLKQLCVSYILENLSNDIVCEALILADQAEDHEFLDNIASSAANIPGFLKSTEWKDFASKFTGVAVKVYFKYFNSH